MDVYLCEDIDPYGYGFHHTGGIATHSDRFFYRCTTQVVIPHTHSILYTPEKKFNWPITLSYHILHVIVTQGVLRHTCVCVCVYIDQEACTY